MMLPDRDTRRTAAYQQAPLGELLAVLLRQWRRPLLRRGLPLSEGDAASLAQAIASRQPHPQLDRLAEALRALVAESEAVLAGWGLSFASALDTTMNDLPGWQSTAEFLELAERKANAELRISTGAALLVALGEHAFAPPLIALVRRGVEDLDAAIARRTLAFASGLDPAQPAWLEALERWYTE
jgi:hypothetical protein